MDTPYRDPAAAPILEAPSRDGAVRLEVGPRHVRLELSDRLRMTVAGTAVTWVRRRRRGDHPRELPLGPTARLWPARSFPTRDLAVWYESRPGWAERLGGVRAAAGFEPSALAAWRDLDRLADELGQVLAPHGGGAVSALELGRGHHRVLLVELPGRLVVYARPLFRERARRALEVARDGTVLVPDGRRDRAVRFDSRAQVTVSGDSIRVAGADGRSLASLWLPWIAVEDRRELVRRFGELVDPAPPEPDYEPRTGWRPWASGLGPGSLAALLPAPLPRSVRARHDR